MKRLFLVSLLAAATTVFAQNRTAELDQAYEEARNATTALQQAIARRDQAVESILEQDVEIARRRYEAAMKRWNDLK
jgi:hypothetical protein